MLRHDHPFHLIIHRRRCLSDNFTYKSHRINRLKNLSSATTPSHLPPHLRSMPASITFNLPKSKPLVPITIAAHLSSTLSQKALLSFPAFKTWSTTLLHSLLLQDNQPNHPFKSEPYTLRSISIDGATFFGHDPNPLKNRLGFLTLTADVSNDKGERLPGTVFLRGGSVAILIILEPTEPKTKTKTKKASGSSSSSSSRSTSRKRTRQGTSDDTDGEAEEYVLLTCQPRIPAGSLSFLELPAGMLDDHGSFAGAAAAEIKEETGLEIAEDELVDLTKLAASFSPGPFDVVGPEPLQQAVYPSPGGSDEFIAMLYTRKKISRSEIEELKGKLTGLVEEGEKISLKVVRLADVWKECFRSGDALAALALYHGLKGEGRII